MMKCPHLVPVEGSCFAVILVLQPHPWSRVSLRPEELFGTRVPPNLTRGTEVRREMVEKGREVNQLVGTTTQSGL